MNRTNWEHAAWALLLMAVVWIAVAPAVDWLVANPAYIPMAFGATVGSVWFVAREHTHAELRYIAAYGYRQVAPSWPEVRCLHPDNWRGEEGLDAMLDWIIAALVVWTVGPAIVYWLSLIGGS